MPGPLRITIWKITKDIGLIILLILRAKSVYKLYGLTPEEIKIVEDLK